ncbi:hypothetical protein HMPREF3201_01107 [Megasphaera sp. MJR8396C]|nr:hypothetical protein HMPREF3201_01107 [Megasphaera sp. MJR8396C]
MALTASSPYLQIGEYIRDPSFMHSFFCRFLSNTGKKATEDEENLLNLN